MAMIATITGKPERISPSMKAVFGTLALDASYPAGGYLPTMSEFRGTEMKFLQAATGPYNGEWVPSTGRLKITTSTTDQPDLSFSPSDVKGAVNTDSENTDASAEPLSGNQVADYTTVVGGAWTVGSITGPVPPRNVCVVIKNDSGGALNLYEGVTTFTVSGNIRGAATTEAITFTSSAGNKSVANNKFRYKYGAKPFDDIASIVITNVPANSLKIAVGLGASIGLPETISVAGDVIRAAKNGVDVTLTGLIDITNSSVKFSTIPDYGKGWATFGGCAAAENTNSENADQAAGPSNDDLVINFTAIAAGAWTGTVVAQPDYPRNVCVTVKNDTVGALNLYEGVSTYTITGIFNAAAQTETITYTSIAGNKSVAAAQFRYKYGLKPFDTITSVTITTNLPDNALKIGAGIGALLGLPTEAFPRSVTTDIISATKAGADYVLSAKVSAANKTLDLGTTTLGDDVQVEFYSLEKGCDLDIVYKGAGRLTSVGSEVPNTTNLSAITAMPFMAFVDAPW